MSDNYKDPKKPLRILLHKDLIEAMLVPSCLNCENFEAKTEQCELAPGQRPPAEILVYGCGMWAPLIPF